MANTVTIRASAPGAKEAAGDIGNLRAAFERLSTTAKGAAIGAVIGTAAVAGMKAIGGLADEYDDASDRIRTGTGKTGAALAELEQSFQRAGGRVKEDIGLTSEVLTELSKRTGLTGQALEDLTVNVIEFSRVTGTDAATNTALVTRLFGDWSVATEDQSETMDKLLRASQATGLGVDALMQTVVQFGAPLRAMGLSMEESIALLGKWEKEGVNIETVLAGMRMAVGKFAAAGIDPKEGLPALIAKVQGLDDAQGLLAVKQVVGQRAANDFFRAIKEGRFDVDTLMAAIENGSETVRDAAADTRDAGDSIAEFKNKVKLAIGPIVDDFAGLTDELGNAIYLLPAVGGAIGGVTGKLVAQTVALKAASGGWIGMGAAMAPVALGAAAVGGGLIAVNEGLNITAENMRKVRDAAAEMTVEERETARTQEILGMSVGSITDNFANFLGVVAPWHQVAADAREATDALNGTFDALNGTLRITADGYQDFGRRTAAAGVALNELADDADDAGEAIGTDFASALRGSADTVDSAMDDLTYVMTHQWEIQSRLARIAGELTGTQLKAGLASTNPLIRGQAERAQQILLGEWESLTGSAFDAGRDAGKAYMRGINGQIGGVKNPFKDPNRDPGHKGPGGRAHGGDLDPGEWSVVGEEGPELIRGGKGGAHVFSNPQSNAMMGPSTINVHVSLNNREVAAGQKHYASIQSGGGFR